MNLIVFSFLIVSFATPNNDCIEKRRKRLACTDPTTSTPITSTPNIKGEPGDPGPMGVPGEKGPNGDTGETGSTGEIGEKGEQGDKGDTGTIGATGPPGIQGEKGQAGQQGPKGETGIPGIGIQGIVIICIISPIIQYSYKLDWWVIMDKQKSFRTIIPVFLSGDQGPPGILPSTILSAAINDQLSSDTAVCIIII